MLDIKFIREHTEEVRQNLKNRHAQVDLDALLEADARRRELLGQVEAMKNRRNDVTKEISVLKRNKENADEKIAAMKELGDEIAVLDGKVKEAEEQMLAVQLMIPNMCHPSVPVGNDDSDNPEVRKWGDVTTFDFEAKNHWEIGEHLGILDAERAGKVAFLFLPRCRCSFGTGRIQLHARYAHGSGRIYGSHSSVYRQP